jgi:multidrug efflux pump subunit AcrA (membrane-fusion protein)
LLSAIRRTNELDTRVKHLSASAESADGLSERVRVILELASAEVNAMTTQAGKLLEQAKTTQTELDHRQAQLDADQRQLLASARAEADQLREQRSRRRASSASRRKPKPSAFSTSPGRPRPAWAWQFTSAGEHSSVDARQGAAAVVGLEAT